jgi:hypothetical protein
MLLHIGGIDRDASPLTIRRVEGDFVQHPLHHRLQPAGADVFDRRVEVTATSASASMASSVKVR